MPDATIDSALARVLRVKFALGLFDDASIDPDSASHWANHPSHRQLAREAAQASLVLLENREGTLPLAPSLRRLAVIGAEADTVRFGGYSGTGIAPVTMLDGIRARAGRDVRIEYARGVPRLRRQHVVIPETAFSHDSSGTRRPGLRARLWANNSFSGAPRVERVDARVDFGWTLSSPAPGIPYDWYSGRWTGRLRVPAGGVRRIGVEGNDGYRLRINGQVVAERWYKRGFGVELQELNLAEGEYEISLEYYESRGNARLKLVWDHGLADDSAARIAEAVRVARASEAAVVVVGIEEGEFRDRARLSLPGDQEALIKAVAATGTPTTVVIVGGSAVTMSRWLDDVGAVLFAWYPGEEGGNAVADLLFGDVSPSGRLPITFPVEEGQLPLTYDHKPTGRGDDYLDLTGHPLFPFGHGLSYTTFRYDSLSLRALDLADGPGIEVRFRVTNTGTRRAHEVAQVYLRDVLTNVAQPLIALKGFARVDLQPGESRELRLTLTREHLRMLNEEMQWGVEPGTFRVMVGASSRDIRLREEIVLP
ncbi:MAG TPA: glycoside hydrolase family 3 C-terminal domain-containing protein [Gemmatimonadaceae bacterium]|nr:glycoside hydrolase family 3 C-terminal domain-containing protein [Gemmatimonadaceae bacterium]